MQVSHINRTRRPFPMSRSLDYDRNKRITIKETLFKNDETLEQYIEEQHKTKERKSSLFKMMARIKSRHPEKLYQPVNKKISAALNKSYDIINFTYSYSSKEIK